MRLDITDPNVVEMLKTRIDKNTGEPAMKTFLKSKEIREGPVEKPRKTKYGNKCFYAEGLYWRSQWEYDCYQELKLYEKSKLISNLEIQIPFEFIVNEVKIGKYVADFRFEYNGETIVADAKSVATEKQVKTRYQNKLMLALYNTKVLHLYRGKNVLDQIEILLK